MLEGTPSPVTPSATRQNTNVFATCEPKECIPSCENVFDMVHVSYLIRGGTRVMWTLSTTFNDPQPWTFQLQTSWTAGEDPTAWEDVGLPVDNSCYAIDPNQRNYSRGVQSVHYRVKLTTPVAEYYSEPTAKAGILSVRDWNLAREMVRKEKLRHRYANQDGYLLKRRSGGALCSRCLDIQTNEVTDPYCPQCWGTGKECGYFYPLACVWADLSPVTRRRHIDDQAVRGTILDITVSARMLMLPLVDAQDVWVSRKTDDRYYIQAIQHVAELRGVPLIANVELRPAPFSDVIYRIPIPQQDAWLQEHC
jgi:hypothetical protein